MGQFVGSTKQIGTQERHHPRGLGKGTVIADVHADLEPAGLVHGERPIAGVGKHVDAQERQMNFAVGGDNAVRARKHARVEQPVAVALEHPENAEAAMLPAGGGQSFYGRAIDRDGMRQPFFARSEAVT